MAADRDAVATRIRAQQQANGATVLLTDGAPHPAKTHVPVTMPAPASRPEAKISAADAELNAAAEEARAQLRPFFRRISRENEDLTQFA